MITEDMLRQWSTLTLREALKASPLNETVNWQAPPDGRKEKIRFIRHLRDLRKPQSNLESEVLDTVMTGALSQGWKDLNRDTIFFQDCLAAVHRAYPEKWTPADYLLQCYITAKRKGVPIEEMDLGRALRNLPSFMREYLIAGKLSHHKELQVEVPSEALNAEYHVDLILNVNGKKIYVWSYLSSAHAIHRLTKNKLNGARGKILNGLNMLAPFDKFKDTVNIVEWWTPSEEYIDLLISNVSSTIMDYETLRNIAKESNDQLTYFSKFILFENRAI